MAGINSIRDKAKLLWIKGMKTVGNTAANIANNTKFKVDEMTIQNRRRELSGDLSHTVYSLWMKGTSFPPEVTKMLEELQKLDDRLNDMRAEKYAQGKAASTETEPEKEPPSGKNDQKDEATEEKKPTEDEQEEEPLSEAITMASPALRSEINGCFDSGSSVDKAAEKVNTSLDQLTEKIRSFSPETNDQDYQQESEEEK